MNVITITEIAQLMGGMLLIYFGFMFRKRDPKRNWLVFVAGGVALFVFSLLVLTGVITLK